MKHYSRYLPDLLTLGNLFSGFLGIVSVIFRDLAFAGTMVFIAALFDLLDGWTARVMGQSSPLGKQLDSLADLVSFGVLPGLIVHILLIKTHQNWIYALYLGDIPLFSLLPFIIPAAGAIRLARYNLREKETVNFRGLPIPAAGILLASLPLILESDLLIFQYQTIYLSPWVLNSFVLTALVVVVSWLMITRIPVFALKFDNYSWNKNRLKYTFLAFSLLLFVLISFAAIPVIIFIYLMLSITFKNKIHEIHSRN